MKKDEDRQLRFWSQIILGAVKGISTAGMISVIIAFPVLIGYLWGKGLATQELLTVGSIASGLAIYYVIIMEGGI